jgi:hypothetical protein
MADEDDEPFAGPNCPVTASIELPQLAVEKSVSANPPPAVELPPLFVESAAKLQLNYSIIKF